MEINDIVIIIAIEMHAFPTQNLAVSLQEVTIRREYWNNKTKLEARWNAHVIYTWVAKMVLQPRGSRTLVVHSLRAARD